MGKRGPKPKNSQLKALEGNPGKRELNFNQPMPTGDASAPPHLNEDAEACWELIVNSMPPGFYTSADVPALSAFCMSWSLHKQATEEINKKGAVINGKGMPYQSPWLGILNRQADIMAKQGDRLGLSPGARESLKIPAKGGNAPQSKFAGLLGKAVPNASSSSLKN